MVSVADAVHLHVRGCGMHVQLHAHVRAHASCVLAHLLVPVRACAVQGFFTRLGFDVEPDCGMPVRSRVPHPVNLLRAERESRA